MIGNFLARHAQLKDPVMTYKCIDINDALPLIENNALIVDIRDNISFQSGHMNNAFNLNNDNIGAYIAESDKSLPLIVCCYHGNSSKNAAAFLADQGFKDVYSLNGGFGQWSAVFPDQCSQD
jgi:thiosulfate sulfurtransferase